MADIVPALLPATTAEFLHGLERLRGVAPLVQVDLVGTDIFAAEDAMPLWQEFDFEFDLMLGEPEVHVGRAIELGAVRVVIHAQEAGAEAALRKLQAFRTGDYASAAGLALGAHDELEALAAFAGLYDFVQVMGIDHIGKQGEPPDPHHRELALIKKLRAQYPDLFIQVDGASAAHPRELVDAGANRLIVGSAIVHAENPQAAYKALYTEANGERPGNR